MILDFVLSLIKYTASNMESRIDANRLVIKKKTLTHEEHLDFGFQMGLCLNRLVSCIFVLRINVIFHPTSKKLTPRAGIAIA